MSTSVAALIRKTAAPRPRPAAVRALVLAAALAVTAGAACTPRVDVRGNLPDPQALAAIKVGTSSREEVEDALGSPSTSNPFGATTWFYISQQTSTMAFMPPEVIERKVLAIGFDEKGVVNKLEAYGLADGRAITPADGKTPSGGNEITLLQQFFANLGRFNSSGPSGPMNVPGQ
jgi:outer membrane protein assembly factor BamE (lipoprotein component of BamABCDE complex)